MADKLILNEAKAKNVQLDCLVILFPATNDVKDYILGGNENCQTC